MPHVAEAIAAASLTPSPTIATGPCARASSTYASLSSGDIPPTQRSGARPSARPTVATTRGSSPERISICQPSASSAATAAGASARIGSASPATAVTEPSTAIATGVSPRRATSAIHVSSRRPGLHRERIHAGEPTRTCRPATMPSMPRPSSSPDLGGRHGRRRGRGEREGDRVRAARLDGGGERPRVDVAEPGRDRELAFGQRAGLVDVHHAGHGEPLERVRTLDEDAAPRGATERDGDRERRRERERARARDDQHRHRVLGRELRRHEPPAHERQRRDDTDDRHEPPGEPVDQARDRRPPRRHRSIVATSAPTRVCSPTARAHSSSGPTRFTVPAWTRSPGATSTGRDSPVSSPASIARSAAGDHAVDGDGLARADLDAVVDHDRVDRDLDDRPGRDVDPARSARRQREQELGALEARRWWRITIHRDTSSRNTSIARLSK